MYASIVDTFNGLPLHVLVVHATVILTPVAALSALALLLPSWRTRLRWPVAGVVLTAWLLVWLARASGAALATSIADQLSGTATGTAVAHHRLIADRLNYALFALLVVVVLVALVMPRLSRTLSTVAAMAVAVMALVVLGLVAQTGEAGSRAAWNPDGSQDYSVH